MTLLTTQDIHKLSNSNKRLIMNRKMKWYRKLWNVITGNKWRNKRWVLVHEIPKYDKPYEEEKDR